MQFCHSPCRYTSNSPRRRPSKEPVASFQRNEGLTSPKFLGGNLGPTSSRVFGVSRELSAQVHPVPDVLNVINAVLADDDSTPVGGDPKALDARAEKEPCGFDSLQFWRSVVVIEDRFAGHYDSTVLVRMHRKEKELCRRSLFAFPIEGRLRQAVLAFIEWWVFDRFILLCIVFSSILLGFEDHRAPANVGVGVIKPYANLVLFVIFSSECVLKIMAWGLILDKKTYLRDAWNCIDVLVVMFGVVDMLPMTSEDSFGMNFLRLVRVTRPLRSLNAIPRMKVLVNTVLLAIPRVGKVMLMGLFLFFVFGIIGVTMLFPITMRRCYIEPNPVLVDGCWSWNVTDDDRVCGGNYMCEDSGGYCKGYLEEPEDALQPLFKSTGVLEVGIMTSEGVINGFPWCPDVVHYGRRWAKLIPGTDFVHFDNIGGALLLITQCMTLEGWTDIWYIVMDGYGVAFSWIYFMAMIWINSFFLLNVALAVVDEARAEFQEETIMKVEAPKLNDKVCVYKAFFSNSVEPELLCEGEQGVVVLVDKQGDVLVKFESADRAEWICRQKFVNLQKPQECGDDGLEAESKASDPERMFQFSEGTLWWNNRIVNFFNEIATSEIFGNFILIVIVANVIGMAMQTFPPPKYKVTSTLDVLEFVYLSIFVAEMIIVVVAKGPMAYIKNPATAFDGCVIAVSIVEVCTTNGGNTFTALRTVKLIRVLNKLAINFVGLRVLLKAMIHTGISLNYWLVLFVLVLYICTLMMVNIFANAFQFQDPDTLAVAIHNPDPFCPDTAYLANIKGYGVSARQDCIPRCNFDTFLIGFLTVFQIMTSENWNFVMYAGLRSKGVPYVVTFLFLIFFIQIIFLSLFLSMLISKFHDCQRAIEVTEAKHVMPRSATLRTKLLTLVRSHSAVIWFDSKYRSAKTIINDDKLLRRTFKDTAHKIRMAEPRLSRVLSSVGSSCGQAYDYNMSETPVKHVEIEDGDDAAASFDFPPMHSLRHASLASGEDSKAGPGVGVVLEGSDVDFNGDRANLGRTTAWTYSEEALSPCPVPGQVADVEQFAGEAAVVMSSLAAPRERAAEAAAELLGVDGGDSDPYLLEVISIDAPSRTMAMSLSASMSVSSESVSKPKSLPPEAPPDATLPEVIVGEQGHGYDREEAANPTCDRSDDEEGETSKRTKPSALNEGFPQAIHQGDPLVRAAVSEPSWTAPRADTNGMKAKRGESYRIDVEVDDDDDDDDEDADLAKAFSSSLSRKSLPMESMWPFDYSLMLFSRRNYLRVLANEVITLTIPVLGTRIKFFDNFILLCIFISSAAMVLDTPLSDPKNALTVVIRASDQVFTVIFLFEFIVKVIASGLIFGKVAYFKSAWNWLDAFVVSFAVFDYTSPSRGGFVKTLRILRAFRPLRVISRNENLKIVVLTIFSAIPDLGMILVVTFLFLLIFALVFVSQLAGLFYKCDIETIAFLRNTNDSFTAPLCLTAEPISKASLNSTGGQFLSSHGNWIMPSWNASTGVVSGAEWSYNDRSCGEQVEQSNGVGTFNWRRPSADTPICVARCDPMRYDPDTGMPTGSDPPPLWLCPKKYSIAEELPSRCPASAGATRYVEEEMVGINFVTAMQRKMVLPCAGSVVEGADSIPRGLSCRDAFCPIVADSTKADCHLECEKHPNFCERTPGNVCHDADSPGCKVCLEECRAACECPFCQPLIADAALCVEQGGTWDQSMRENFDNIFSAMLTLFEIHTTEGWVDVMQHAMDATDLYLQPRREESGALYGILFMIWILLSSMFLVNLSIGIVVEKYMELKMCKLYAGKRRSQAQVKWMEYKSLLSKRWALFSLTNLHLLPAWRRRLYELISSKVFDNSILVSIIINTFFMAAKIYPAPASWWDDVCANINIFFAAVFIMEAVIKLTVLRMNYFFEAWNIFDFICVALTLIGLIVSHFLQVNVAGVTLIIRVFRTIRLFRLVKLLKFVNRVFAALLYSLPSLANVVAVLMLLYCLFGILGVSLFGAVSRELPNLSEDVNFRDFFWAITTLFRATTGEAWNYIMHDLALGETDYFEMGSWCTPDYIFNADVWDVLNEKCLIEKPNACVVAVFNMSSLIVYLYWVIFTIIIIILLMNLVITVILDGYAAGKENPANEIIDLCIEIWKKYDPDQKMFISFSDALRFVDQVVFVMYVRKENERSRSSKEAKLSGEARRMRGLGMSRFFAETERLQLKHIPVHLAKAWDMKLEENNKVHITSAVLQVLRFFVIQDDDEFSVELLQEIEAIDESLEREGSKTRNLEAKFTFKRTLLTVVASSKVAMAWRAYRSRSQDSLSSARGSSSP